ncbi:MAG: hypothetical protein AAGI06_06360 [Pseudomonadota bacterium]
MADPEIIKDLIALADTIAKIGLGAAIAGFFGWISAGRLHRHAMTMKSVEDRRQILRETSRLFQDLDNAVRGFLAHRRHAIRKFNNDYKATPSLKKIFDKHRNAMIEASGHMGTIRSNLLLLEESEAEEAVADYEGFLTRTDDKLADLKSDVKADEVLSIVRDLTKRRAVIFQALAEAYKRTE